MDDHPAKKGPYRTLTGVFFVFAYERDRISRDEFEKRPMECPTSALAVVFILVVMEVSWMSGPQRAVSSLPIFRDKKTSGFFRAATTKCVASEAPRMPSAHRLKSAS